MPTKKKVPIKAKKGPMEAKKEGKGPYEGQNEGQRPLKIFCSAKNQKVRRAYESLDPALNVTQSKIQLVHWSFVAFIITYQFELTDLT